MPSFRKAWRMVDTILLTGGTARMRGPVEYMQAGFAQRVGVPTYGGSPTRSTARRGDDRSGGLPPWPRAGGERADGSRQTRPPASAANKPPGPRRDRRAGTVDTANGQSAGRTYTVPQLIWTARAREGAGRSPSGCWRASARAGAGRRRLGTHRVNRRCNAGSPSVNRRSRPTRSAPGRIATCRRRSRRWSRRCCSFRKHSG